MLRTPLVSGSALKLARKGVVLLIVLAVIIFLVGLVSEQISTLRAEGPR